MSRCKVNLPQQTASRRKDFYERQDFVAAWHLQEGRQADYRCRHDDWLNTKSKAKLVIFANDFSKSSKKSVQTAADECNVKTLTMNRSKEEIGFALGKSAELWQPKTKALQISLNSLLKTNREENCMIKYKVKDAAADLGVSNKEIIEILENIAVLQRKQWQHSRKANSMWFLM